MHSCMYSFITIFPHFFSFSPRERASGAGRYLDEALPHESFAVELAEASIAQLPQASSASLQQQQVRVSGLGFRV